MQRGPEETKLEARIASMKDAGLLGFHVTVDDGASDPETVCASLNAMLDYNEGLSLRAA
jgi:hypothetical protein